MGNSRWMNGPGGRGRIGGEWKAWSKTLENLRATFESTHMIGGCPRPPPPHSKGLGRREGGGRHRKILGR